MDSESGPQSALPLSAGAAARGAALPRRERTRLATTDEIKAAAHDLLAPSPDGGDLSLRAVARQVGMTPSAIYRYFESREDLLEALARDAFDSVSATLAAAVEADTSAGSVDRAVAVAHAYRRWCLEHPADFGLIFRTDRPDTRASEAWRAHLLEFYRVPFEVLLRDMAAGEVAITPGAATPAVRADVLEAARLVAQDAEVMPEMVSLLVSLWASVHGFVCLELFGHVGLLMEDADAAFDQHVRAALVAVRRTG
ncbi:WHG domain-containing protein [Nocardioides zeae]|uniref:WHG domain-containing protein n=1 Tax=Nocardioides imazamoxiresistens TaxID=3231893 RepID=A0ABU3PYT8_9ACTN|nr:WHG domain-containing protein [Nocardioides zeae]MDT9594384.1 WHG domain-containing protein [Nocardioides zeae]